MMVNLAQYRQRTDFNTLALCICMMLFTAECMFEESLLEEKLTNGDFSTPVVPYTDNFPFRIQGWSCSTSCQLDNCYQRKIQNVRDYAEPFVDCEGQVIDINSEALVANISQTVILEPRTYRISFNYYYPYERANKKILSVYFNSELVLYVHPQTYSHFSKLTHSANLQAEEGVNTLLFRNSGEVADYMGFRINNVSIRQVIWPQFESWVNTSLSNAIVANIIAFPGIRGILGELLNMCVSLDRFQLYLYHNRTYAYHALLLLQNVNSLLALKGSLARNALNALAPKALSYCQSVAHSLIFKENYAPLLISREPQNGFGFVSNNESLLLYSAPFCILLFVAFNLIFRVLFRWPLSKLFRKFCFGGLLLWMICDGNVEVFTFYVFGEFLTFFSFSILHKMVNVCLSFFYFAVLFTAVAAIWWFRFLYGAKIRYFLQNSKLCSLSMWSVLVDHGVVSIVSGALHQTLKNNSNLQLYCLCSVELVWISLRIFFAVKGVYRRRLYVFFCFFDSFLRIGFQVQAYLFNNLKDMRFFLSDDVMTVIVYIFLGLWYAEIVLAIIYACSELIEVLKMSEANEKQIFPLVSDLKEPRVCHQKLKIKEKELKNSAQLKRYEIKSRHFYFQQFLSNHTLKKNDFNFKNQTKISKEVENSEIEKKIEFCLDRQGRLLKGKLKRALTKDQYSKT